MLYSQIGNHLVPQRLARRSHRVRIHSPGDLIISGSVAQGIRPTICRTNGEMVGFFCLGGIAIEDAGCHSNDPVEPSAAWL